MEKQYSYLLKIVTDHKPTEDEMMELVEGINYTIDNTSLSLDYIGENDGGCGICSCCDDCCDGQHEDGENCDD